MSKECKEWLKVIEIADLLNLSKVSIYNKIKTLNSETLQDLQKKEKGILYYNVKIIDILKDKNFPAEESEEETAAGEEYINYEKEHIRDLRSEIEFLRSQVNELNNRLATEQELTKNMQVLQLKQQQQDYKSLEAHQVEFDLKLSEMKENMLVRQKSKEDSIFKRLFKK